MVTLRSFVRGPLEPYVTRSPKSCFGRTSRPSAEQHVCSIAHLDRWMSAEGPSGAARGYMDALPPFVAAGCAVTSWTQQG